MLGLGPRWPASLGALAGAGVVGVVVGLVGAIAGSAFWAASGASLVAFAGTAFWWLRWPPDALSASAIDRMRTVSVAVAEGSVRAAAACSPLHRAGGESRQVSLFAQSSRGGGIRWAVTAQGVSVAVPGL
jgi:hypothetical protein